MGYKTKHRSFKKEKEKETQIVEKNLRWDSIYVKIMLYK